MDPRYAIAGARAGRKMLPGVVALGAAVWALVAILTPSSAAIALMPPPGAFSEAEVEEATSAPQAAPRVVGEVDASLTDPGDSPQAANGYRPRASKGRAITLQRWGCEVRSAPCISTIGGYAYRTIAGTNTLSDHATGRAIDIMVPDYRGPGRALGDQIAAFFVANAETLRVKYVIWYDEIWQPHNGWQPYGHPGGGRSDTMQHRDHVHVSYEAGA